MKKKTKKTLCILGGAVVGAAACYIASIYLKDPKVVSNPCWRSFNRADGIPKKAFDTALEAKNQAVKQFFLHGEICRPYEAGGNFFTGHSENDLIHSINPIKLIKKLAS